MKYQTRLLIDGKWQDSADAKTFATINPANEAELAQVAEAGPEDVDRAARAARRAFDAGPWRKTSARERGRLLYRLADALESHLEELAVLETLDGGKPIADTRNFDLPGAIATFRYYAGWADKIHGQVIPTADPYTTYTRREPVGVCGQIIPWNFPLCMAAWKLAPALAAGCTVILKPAEQTPLTALRLGELAMEVGFPPGVLNILPGFGPTAGGAIVRHPLVDKIAFTGEYKTAQIIMREASDSLKRLTCELGGKSPNIIFADADFDAAVEGAYGGIFLNQGQNCCAGSRVLVQETIYDRFVEALADKAKRRRVGDPMDPSIEQGPQVDAAQFDRIMQYVSAGRTEGAACVSGGERVGTRGYFVAPTVFADVEDHMRIAREEVFGPLVSVFRFKNLDEVIRRANDSIFGLAAAVWTRDVAKAHAIAANVRAGTVWVNCYNIVDPSAPFGGFKMSGFGRELGQNGLDNYTETKTICINTSVSDARQPVSDSDQ